MLFRRLYDRFFVTRDDYRVFLSYLKFSQDRLKRIRKLIENKDENVYQCFHKFQQKTIEGKEELFKEILDDLYCVEIFLNKCKGIIKESSQTENKEIAEAARAVLNSLNDNYIDETFIYRRQEKPLLETYIEELRRTFRFQIEHIPTTLKSDGSKSDLYVIIAAVSGLAMELEKLYAVLSSFISFLEKEGKRIREIIKEGQDLRKYVSIIDHGLMGENQLMSKITPRHTSGKDETGWLAEKRFINIIRYLEGYRLRLSSYLKYLGEYSPTLEEKSAQDYLIKIGAKILRMKQESQIYKRLYDAYLLDDQRTMAMMIKEQNPDDYVGYNLDMIAYCGVVPKALISGMWVHNTTDSPYITPEGYASRLSEIILRRGYRSSQRYTSLNYSVFGGYAPKNIFFCPKKHTAYGGYIALIGFSVRGYCVLVYSGNEFAIMTPKNMHPKLLTLYVQDPDRLGDELRFVDVNVQGEGHISLRDYIDRFKIELENLHTPFKVDHWM